MPAFIHHCVTCTRASYFFDGAAKEPEEASLQPVEPVRSSDSEPMVGDKTTFEVTRHT